MSNLFWKTKNGTKGLLEKPFQSEEEFENTVFSTSELLKDVFLLKRQIRGGAKTGVPDMVGVDGNGDVCILEMKNVVVDADIIPQVLEYAMWAETNPDSIKSLWLESPNKPEDAAIDWEDFQVRILVIAPSIHRTTLQFVEKINYPVELIEVKRWVEKDNHFLLVNWLQPDKKTAKVKPAKGLPVYDADFYRNHYDKNVANQFLKYATEVEKLIQKNDWNLQKKFTRNACVFKAGFFNAFAIRWSDTRSLSFMFKGISQKELQHFKIPVTKFNKDKKKAYFDIDPAKTRISDFQKLFAVAYQQLAGSNPH